MNNLHAGREFSFVFKNPTCLCVGMSIHRHLKLNSLEVLNVYSALYGHATMLQWYCLCRIRTLFKLLEIHLKSCSQDIETRGHQSAWFALILMLL